MLQNGLMRSYMYERHMIGFHQFWSKINREVKINKFRDKENKLERGNIYNHNDMTIAICWYTLHVKRASTAFSESYATLAKNNFENKGNIVKVWDIAY